MNEEKRKKKIIYELIWCFRGVKEIIDVGCKIWEKGLRKNFFERERKLSVVGIDKVCFNLKWYL